MLDMDKINNINKKYRFRVKQISDTTCSIDSGQEEWLIETTPRTRGIILWHRNHKYDVDNFHVQHSFYDYERTMYSIHTHKEKHMHTNDKVFRMKKLFEQFC